MYSKRNMHVQRNTKCIQKHHMHVQTWQLTVWSLKEWSVILTASFYDMSKVISKFQLIPILRLHIILTKNGCFQNFN